VSLSRHVSHKHHGVGQITTAAGEGGGDNNTNAVQINNLNTFDNYPEDWGRGLPRPWLRQWPRSGKYPWIRYCQPCRMLVSLWLWDLLWFLTLVVFGSSGWAIHISRSNVNAVCMSVCVRMLNGVAQLVSAAHRDL